MRKIASPLFTVIACTLLLSACASEIRTTRLGTPVEPQIIPGKVFVPGKSTASVGEVMLTAGEYAKTATRLKLESFKVKEAVTTSVEHKASTFEFSIPKGDYRLESRTELGSYYYAPKFFRGLNDTRVGYGGLFVPSGATSATEFYWNWRQNQRDVYQAKLNAPIEGTFGTSIVDMDDSEISGPRATLTYAGVASGQIRFVYKEFTKDGLARPAFTQEVSLDYKPGGTYAYKTAKFTVEMANSTHIDFTLLNPL